MQKPKKSPRLRRKKQRMKNKTIKISILTILVGAMLLCSCQSKELPKQTETQSNQATSVAVQTTEATPPEVETEIETAYPIEKPNHDALKFDVTDTISVKVTAYDQWTEYSENATLIEANGDDVTVTGGGVSVEGRRIIISQEGEYLVKGNLSNGQIHIQTAEDKKVHLILENATLHCDFSAPIVCTQADKLIITIPNGTTSEVTDAVSCEDTTAKGSIYATCDLTINGTGTLKVSGNFNHGLSTDDVLKVVQTKCEVSAAEVALRGKDGVALVESAITVTVAEDAIKSNKKDNAEKGFVFVSGGSLNLTADDDCIQATSAVVLKDAEILARCMGKTVNCDGTIVGEDLITKWN